MTEQITFFNWQNSGYKPGGAPFNRDSPNLMAFKAYIMNKWGGMNLGCFGVRPIRGGTEPSSHAYGAAWDWRYAEPGPGRPTADAVIAFTITWSKELGIDAIHDYVRSRIWRAGRGWLNQPHDSEMGQSWAEWLHFETTQAMWGDATPVANRLVQPLPPFNPANGQYSIYPVIPKPVCAIGASGDVVRYLQAVMQREFPKKYYTATVDGQFGMQTDKAVRAMQFDYNLVVDGKVGAKTWLLVDFAARPK